MCLTAIGEIANASRKLLKTGKSIAIYSCRYTYVENQNKATSDFADGEAPKSAAASFQTG